MRYKNQVASNNIRIGLQKLFNDQNKEGKLIKAQIVRDDATVDKYNIEAVTSFIKMILADLGETYKKSSIPQLKVLLGLVFPYGIT